MIGKYIFTLLLAILSSALGGGIERMQACEEASDAGVHLERCEWIGQQKKEPAK